MSKSLWIECDPIDQPAAKDPVERMTWCALKIRIGDRFVTRVWDKLANAERTAVYVPAFPIAEWIASNWWFLWNEGQRNQSDWTWNHRHCLRSADSSSLIPSLILFNDGEYQRAIWNSDQEGSLPHMPAEFVSYGDETLDLYQSRQAVIDFVNDTLGRVSHLSDDQRVHDLSLLWKSIRSADKDEQEFCELSGRFGVSPYDPEQMTDDLASFFETSLSDTNDPLVTDLVDISIPKTLKDQWEWIIDVSKDLSIGPISSQSSFTLPIRNERPAVFGYELARSIRKTTLKNPSNDRIDSVESIAQTVLGKGFRLESRNHLPGIGIKSLIGQSNSGEYIAAGPPQHFEYNQRFLIARCLYQALTNPRLGKRLITTAHSWDQQASRAFAAELLLPQQILKNRFINDVERSEIEDISQQYNVSDWLTRRQLKNAKIAVVEEYED